MANMVRLPIRSPSFGRTSPTIANRGSLETVIPAVPEEACGILCGDAAECRTDRCMQGVDRARTDLAQLGLELGPGGLDRAQIRAVGRQVAIGEPRTLEHGLHLGRLVR